MTTKPINNMNPTSLRKNTAFVVSVIAACTAMVSGCSSTRPMALDANKGRAAAPPKAIGVFTLRTENQLKPKYQPKVTLVEIVSDGSGQISKFQVKKPLKEAKDQYYEYLISVELDPGAYTVGKIRGGATGFLISGHFEFPVNGRFSLSPGSVAYLGHVTMTNRQRKDPEPRSGGTLPLIDQSVTGFSGGTFDITVSDRSDSDLSTITATYPALGITTVTKAIMQR